MKVNQQGVCRKSYRIPEFWPHNILESIRAALFFFGCFFPFLAAAETIPKPVSVEIQWQRSWALWGQGDKLQKDFDITITLKNIGIQDTGVLVFIPRGSLKTCISTAGLKIASQKENQNIQSANWKAAGRQIEQLSFFLTVTMDVGDLLNSDPAAWLPVLIPYYVSNAILNPGADQIAEFAIDCGEQLDIAMANTMDQYKEAIRTFMTDPDSNEPSSGVLLYPGMSYSFVIHCDKTSPTGGYIACDVAYRYFSLTKREPNGGYVPAIIRFGNSRRLPGATNMPIIESSSFGDDATSEDYKNEVYRQRNDPQVKVPRAIKVGVTDEKVNPFQNANVEVFGPLTDELRAEIISTSATPAIIRQICDKVRTSYTTDWLGETPVIPAVTNEAYLILVSAEKCTTVSKLITSAAPLTVVDIRLKHDAGGTAEKNWRWVCTCATAAKAQPQIWCIDPVSGQKELILTIDEARPGAQITGMDVRSDGRVVVLTTDHIILAGNIADKTRDALKPISYAYLDSPSGTVKWAPGKDWVVFSTKNNGLHLIDIDPKTNDEKALTTTGGDQVAAVSPEGIIYFWNPSSRPPDRGFLLPINGPSVLPWDPFESHDARPGSMSPDGSTLLADRSKQPGQYVVTTAGKSTQIGKGEQVIGGASSWAQDGQEIALRIGGNLWTVKKDGSGLRQLTHGELTQPSVWGTCSNSLIPPTPLLPPINLTPEKQATFAGITFCWCPPGTFAMGAASNEQGKEIREEPQHQVTISKGFWISKYEITQTQWLMVMRTNPSSFKGPDLPVENVSWIDCQEFAKRMNARGEGSFRLPTEAEWEYACRAGTTSRFYWGEDLDLRKIDDCAWYFENWGHTTHIGGGKQPNAWGLCDMAGNLYEWCEDDFHYNYSQAPTDGRAWRDSPRNRLNVLRGGAWNAPPPQCRSASRRGDGSNNKFDYYGFRIVRNP